MCDLLASAATRKANPLF